MLPLRRLRETLAGHRRRLAHRGRATKSPPAVRRPGRIGAGRTRAGRQAYPIAKERAPAGSDVLNPYRNEQATSSAIFLRRPCGVGLPSLGFSRPKAAPMPRRRRRRPPGRRFWRPRPQVLPRPHPCRRRSKAPMNAEFRLRRHKIGRHIPQLGDEGRNGTAEIGVERAHVRVARIS